MSKKSFIIVSPIIFGLTMLFLRDVLSNFIINLKPCFFHRITGFYCPGCGNSRCIIALLHGHIVAALRSNLTVPFLVLMILLLYIENIMSVFGKKIHLLPRKTWVWMCVIALFMLYFIARNFIPQIAPV